jgi:hypothetical protein
MRVREYDCGWRNGREPIQPIGPTIDHDASVSLPNEEGTVTSMPARPKINLAARAKKRQLEHLMLTYIPIRRLGSWRPDRN